MVQAVVTPSTTYRWQAALDRAVANAIDVLVATDGSAFVESASTPGLLYAVSRESCSCPAGTSGQICQHRACYLAQIGELQPQSADRITFFGNSDRQEVRVGGMVYGDAVADQWGGWELFRGRFPHARKVGTYCSLEEITRELEVRLPVPMPVVRVTDLVSAVA